MTSALDYLEEFRNEAELCAEIKTYKSQHSKKSELFQVFFLLNDDAQSVEVMETQEIDLEEVTACLKLGDSIFITNKDCTEV
jgi:hypothetical protein